MEKGPYRVMLELNLLKDVKRETLETLFETIVDRSGSMIFLHMSEPVRADSSQAILESIIVEAIRDASLDDVLSDFYTAIEDSRKTQEK